jgi:D-3-phosphoglycerate dehydrogenase / 2-oxoglutarate reductase
MRIVLNAEPIHYSEAAIETWKQRGFHYQSSSWDEINLSKVFPQVEILIVRLAQKVDSEVLNKFPHLKKVVTATTGIDHIDTDELRTRNIELVCLRNQNEFLKTIPSTAEHTWGLLMALIRNIPAANEHVRKGNWNRDLFKGYQLKNKTIGILGMGRTGSKVAYYASAFDMNVIFFDPHVIKSQWGTKVNELKQILSKSDIISVHVHLSEDTKQLLNAENLCYIKPKAFIINTSRGKLVDEDVLASLLRNNIISGIASDVLCNEFDDIRCNSLWKLQNEGYNVILTPHIGGATWDAMWSCEEYIVKKLIHINH